LDPELDLGCLPYRERFASGAPDEVHFGDHFASPFRQGQKNKTLERYEIKKKEEEIVGNQKAKKQKQKQNPGRVLRAKWRASLSELERSVVPQWPASVLET
jgi:hypothetical protein